MLEMMGMEATPSQMDGHSWLALVKDTKVSETKSG
jgi:hypothetical protein